MKAGPEPCLKCNPLSGAVCVIETDSFSQPSPALCPDAHQQTEGNERWPRAHGGKHGAGCRSLEAFQATVEVCHRSQARKFPVHKKPTWINAAPKREKSPTCTCKCTEVLANRCSKEKAGSKPRQSLRDPACCAAGVVCSSNDRFKRGLTVHCHAPAYQVDLRQHGARTTPEDAETNRPVSNLNPAGAEAAPFHIRYSPNS